MAKVNLTPDMLRPNSHKYREAQGEKKEIKKVVTGKVQTRKKPISKKISETFLSEDIQDVKSHVFFDVLVPAIKDMVGESIKQALDMILYGSTSSSASRKSKPYSRVSYSSYYDRSSTRAEQEARGRTKSRDFYDVVLETRAEADEVLDCLRDIIDQYGKASLADYCDLCGITPSSYTDNRYGWTDLSDATVKLVRGHGYIIELPKAYILD